jgi:PKD repeat protein
MRKILLFALIVSGMISSAQTNHSDGNCNAYFKYGVNTLVMSALPATAINFNDKSEGAATYWWWDFGDGNTSTEQNPMHVFSHPEQGPLVKISPYRTVSLTILTADTCKSIYSETINIMDGSSGNSSWCKAAFQSYQMAYDAQTGKATVQLNSYSDGDSLSYFWSFEDGQTSTEMNPEVTFDIKPGKYQACLTVSGKNNCADTFCDVIYIADPNSPDPEPAKCYTEFGYSVNFDYKTFAPALVLDFHSRATPEAIEWSWDFGDGIASEEQNPTHIFSFPLSTDSILADPNPFRKVCLTVTTADGCVASDCQTIDIYMKTVSPDSAFDQCHAWYKYERATDVITFPEVIPYRFKDVSEGKVVRRLWKFEDGTTSTDAELQINFDFMKPTQEVCLTIFTADSCTSSFCQTVYVSEIKPDTVYVNPAWGYTMRYESSFPIQMSSCAGWAKAQVYLKDSVVGAYNYSWSTGEMGQEVKGLCPTQTYTVKAMTPDGTVVSGTFVFNSDGTVTEIPIDWWVTGVRDNPLILAKPFNKDHTVEWKLCDGTIVVSDSIPLNLINCGSSESNLIMKDATGKVVYSESINMKILATYLDAGKQTAALKVYPNPVKDVLNITYSGSTLNEMQIEIRDVMGRLVSSQKINGVESGQNISLNVSMLRSGIYLCRMFAGNQLLGVQKFNK